MINKMADDTKTYFALLNGIARRNYYGDNDITDAYLKEEIYPEISEEDFSIQLTQCTSLLKSLVSADMDRDQLEAFLTAQISRKDGTISENQAIAIRKFWKSHKTKIHDSIIANTSWGNSLEKVLWRIDLQSQARHIEELNIPSAIMELHIQEKASKTEDVVRFEMDEKRLTSILKSMQEIEKAIDKNS